MSRAYVRHLRRKYGVQLSVIMIVKKFSIISRNIYIFDMEDIFKSRKSRKTAKMESFIMFTHD